MRVFLLLEIYSLACEIASTEQKALGRALYDAALTIETLLTTYSPDVLITADPTSTDYQRASYGEIRQ